MGMATKYVGSSINYSENAVLERSNRILLFVQRSDKTLLGKRTFALERSLAMLCKAVREFSKLTFCVPEIPPRFSARQDDKVLIYALECSNNTFLCTCDRQINVSFLCVLSNVRDCDLLACKEYVSYAATLFSHLSASTAKDTWGNPPT